MRALLRPRPAMNGGPLSNPILIACPKKRKRIFTKSATFCVSAASRTVTRGYSLTGAALPLVQDVFLLLQEKAHRKSQIWRIGQKPKFLRGNCASVGASVPLETEWFPPSK